MLRTPLATAILLASLTACGPKPDDGQSQPAGSAGTAPTAESGPSSLSVDPTSVVDCQPVVATVAWDLRKTHPEVANVQIFAGTAASSNLFTEGGAYGSAKTGQWTGSGSLFSLRDKAGGKEIERVIVSGPACG